MKLKLTKTTLLLFFIGVLVLGMCCGIVVEGMKNNDDQKDHQNDDKRNEKSHEIHKPDGDRLMRQWMDKNIYDIKQKPKWSENHLYQDESKPEPDYKIGAPVETATSNGATSNGAATHAASLTANPKGIPKNQIPKGDEDRYILKSQIVPPVCPACPTTSECPREKPCPACPPCARCPEPAFDCKKVPNYRSSNTQYLPRPMLTDFSGF